MLAGRNGALGEADDLVVALDRLPRADGARRDLVSRRHQTRDGHVLVEERGTGDELLARDDYVVGGMQADGEGGLGEHGNLLCGSPGHFRRVRWSTVQE